MGEQTDRIDRLEAALLADKMNVKKDNFFTALVVVMKGLRASAIPFGFFSAIVLSCWNLFGEEMLTKQTDARIKYHLAPIIEVLDTTYYMSVETNKMIRELLKSAGKEKIIIEVEEEMEQIKSIDETRKKLGKDKYEKAN